jgi:hypothetical protein
MVGEVQSSNSPNVALEGNEVPIESSGVSLTQEVQSTPNEINIENQDPEAPVEPTTSPNKRGLKSDAWPYFKRQKIGGIWKAICKSCDKKIGGDTKNGTKHLFDHISICPKRTERGPKQAMLKVTEKKSGNRHESFVVGNYTFNQDVSRNELAKMIILHEYPIMMVNHIGFRNYSHSLQPLFKIVSRNTMKNDIMKLYESEKSKQMKILAKNKSRIAITTDMWTASNQNKGYMSVTAHYIDENWILQNRIIR